MRKRRKTGHSAFTMSKAYAMYTLEKQGYTHADLAKLFSCSERTVRWYLKVNGLPAKRGRPKQGVSH